MLQRLGFPPVGPHRRFVTAIAIDAARQRRLHAAVDALLPGRHADLSLVQVGAGHLDRVARSRCPPGPLIGSLVDRLGAKQVLLAGNVLQAVGFFAYLVADSVRRRSWSGRSS